MSTRRSMVLAIVLALLAGYFALFEGFSTPRVSPDSGLDEPLFDCEQAAPQEITVTTARGSLSARRSGAHWESAAGGLAPAAFESRAEALCRLPVIERIGGAVRLEDFGLEPAAGEIHVVAGSQDKRLLIGASTPASNLMYAKFADRAEVLKIGVELASNVERVARFAPSGSAA